MSQFAFLQTDFPEIYDSALRAESLANSDPRAACFYARRTLELAVTWAYRHDATLRLPYREDLSALVHEATFRNLTGDAVFQKCRAIKDLGNEAVHSGRTITRSDSGNAARELFHICYWFARTYSRTAKPDPGLAFDPAALPPPTGAIIKHAATKLKDLANELTQEREKLFAALADRENIDSELKRLRVEVAAAKVAASAPDTHDYSEAQTRDLFIDLLLREAGWPLDKPEDREYRVTGMPNDKDGFVDYVLWGNDGKPLGLVEAKRTRRDAHQGQQQAKLYADCLEAEFGQRPIIFYTNGYEHWIWDDANYPPRQIQGFYKKAELELLIQRRSSRRSLATTKIDEKIVERYYQTRAIRRVGEAFERDHAREALLVMATGSGKTRTVIALADLLMRANWAKRVLFLADRTALVNQAIRAFKTHLPSSPAVNLVTEKDTEARIYVSTYPTMLGLINDSKGTERRFGVGHFDLVVIDEAHRSVFMKYGAILDYFDSLLVGLTATPKDEVDRNTYELFTLENGVPTDAYPLGDAIDDGYLVRPRSISVPVKLPSQGVTYDLLSDEEKEQFELTDWKDRAEDVLAKGRIDPAEVNNWFFSTKNADLVLKHLMERGQKVDGGDKLGKTIVFAKNREHALFLRERFDKHYPWLRGEFARVIDFKTEHAQDLIDKFSDPNKLPQIAISVDMLDTGIDVPEVVNLAFVKQVRSKTKFWQMLGRGTRLSPNLFGPGQDKEFFYIFDYCGNLEFFKQDLPGAEGSASVSLSQRLFAARVRLLSSMVVTSTGAEAIREHAVTYGEPKTDGEVFSSIVSLLKSDVASMNLGNFIVRAKRRVVEKYQDAAIWWPLTSEKLEELENDLSGLPTQKDPEPFETKQFDLLMLRLELARLKATPGYGKLKQQVQEIAAALEEASSIPIIRDQLELIQDLQTDTWWQDVTLPMLELVRLRLRTLVRLVERKKGSPIFTDLPDEMGEESEVPLPGLVGKMSFERFREKARAFLRQHLDREAIQRLRLSEPLRPEDLSELESILKQSGVGDDSVIQRAAEGGLGLFVRSLVGLDREAAKAALGAHLVEKDFNPDQIEFLNMIVDYLTEHGVMDPKALWASPFTDVNPLGPEGLFQSDSVDGLVQSLREIHATAV